MPYIYIFKRKKTMCTAKVIHEEITQKAIKSLFSTIRTIVLDMHVPAIGWNKD